MVISDFSVTLIMVFLTGGMKAGFAKSLNVRKGFSRGKVSVKDWCLFLFPYFFSIVSVKTKAGLIAFTDQQGSRIERTPKKIRAKKGTKIYGKRI